MRNLFLSGIILSLALAGCAHRAPLPPDPENLNAEIAAANATSEPADYLAERARNLLADCVEKSACDPDSIPSYAEALSREAIKLEPDNAVANVSCAIALAMQAQNMPVTQVYLSGMGAEMRDKAHKVLETEPDNPWAHGFLAVWNLETLRRGGEIGAGLLKASFDKGAAHYKAVEAEAPENLVLKWQYVRALAALDSQKYGAEIQRILGQIIAGKPTDKFEIAVWQRAEKLKTEMDQDEKQAETFARATM